MKSINRILLAAASSAFLAACGMGGAEYGTNAEDVLPGNNIPGTPGNPGDPTQNPDPGSGPGPGPGPAPVVCSESMGRTYKGFGNTVLTVGRVDVALGTDNGRVKPFAALNGYAAAGGLAAATGDYQRVLGNNPALLAQSAATFGADSPRWLVEPQSSAVALYTAYRVAFQGCLTMTATPANYAAAPTAATAPTECGAMARRFWSKTPSADEIAACVKTATVDTAAEADPRRKWAYTCASVMTSAGFLTY